MSKVEELIKQTKEYIKEDCMKENISPIENDFLINRLDSILAEYKREKKQIINILEMEIETLKDTMRKVVRNEI